MSQLGRDALIIEAVRTPVGRGHPEKGELRDIHPTDLLGRTFVEVVRRSGIDASEVDNVLAGCVYQVGEQAQGVTRNAWLQKGLPETTGATTLDIRCGSGQQAVNLGALSISGGADNVVVAGGVEHMGRVGFRVNDDSQKLYGSGISRELRDRFALVSQGEAAELLADKWDISREAMDEFAVESHARANAASVEGRFAREILALETPRGVMTIDQCIRPGTNMESLAELSPVFRIKGGRVTAGNSSPTSDGAAAILLASRDKATELGLRPRARIVDQVTLGVDPITMLTGPIDATRRILARNGMAIGDLDAIEINEAFASVVIAWQRELQPDMAKVNPRGGALALGHPLGATGARLITTLLHQLEDSDGQWGLVTMCCGGGLGIATLIERIDQ
jgi:acetyl-CoA acyltransferase